MFDVGFWELCLVGVISLLVIGPERLPKAARIAGFWLGKTRAVVAAVKAEIKEELREEEIRQSLRKQSGIDEVHKLLDDSAAAGEKIKTSSEHLPASEDGQSADSHGQG